MYLALQPRSKLAPDVILCVGNPGGKALQQTTKTVPIVSIQVAEPVAQGFVQGLRVRVATLFQHSSTLGAVEGSYIQLRSGCRPSPGRYRVGRDDSSPALRYAWALGETPQ